MEIFRLRTWSLMNKNKASVSVRDMQLEAKPQQRLWDQPWRNCNSNKLCFDLKEVDYFRRSVYCTPTITDVLKLVEKMPGDNYVAWKVRIRSFLVIKGFRKVRNPDGEEDKSWNTTKYEQAFALIILKLGQNPILQVENCTTACEAWLKLRGIYAEPSSANSVQLYEKWLTLRLKDGKDARAHVHYYAQTR